MIKISARLIMSSFAFLCAAYVQPALAATFLVRCDVNETFPKPSNDVNHLFFKFDSDNSTVLWAVTEASTKIAIGEVSSKKLLFGETIQSYERPATMDYSFDINRATGEVIVINSALLPDGRKADNPSSFYGLCQKAEQAF
jgi:hypothetical protein